MANDPAVSVVIPTRNRRRLLQEAVASVFQQTFERWELIVVDDASEDDTWAWVSGLAKDRVRAIRLERHSERSRARNVGLEVVQTPFVLFLDDDDLLPAPALQTHVHALESHPAAIASVGGVIRFAPNGWRRAFHLTRRRAVRRIFPDALFSWPVVSGQCLFRTQVIRSVNGWNDSYNFAEDYDLWLRVGRLGPVVLLPDIVLHFRSHQGQQRPPKPTIRHLMTEIRQQALAGLQGQEREKAERILRARRLWAMAAGCSRRLRALGLCLKALQIAPGLLWSPLARPRILASLRRHGIGGTGHRLRRRLFSWWRWGPKPNR